MKVARALPALLALSVAGCHGDVLGIGERDFEGFYSLAGTVDLAAGDAVVGTFTITRQWGYRAEVAIDWSYLNRGEEIIRITTDEPAIAELHRNGDIYFAFEGDLWIDGGWVEFSLVHDGELHGNTVTGWWELWTGLPSEDAGTFTASRM